MKERKPLLSVEAFQTLPKFNTNGGEDPTVHLKYYGPDSAMMWFVTEGQVENGQYRFWGLIIGPYGKHWGYFTIRELETEQGPEGEYVIRDEAFIPRPISQVIEIMDMPYESEQGA